MQRHFAAALDNPDLLLLICQMQDDIIGYGHASVLIPDTTTASTPPSGYYLTGLLVASAWRRRGIGLTLTHARLSWIFKRSDTAWYFSNARNDASLSLHAKLGFTEVTRDFSYPNVSFQGGIGVLACLQRTHYRHQLTRRGFALEDCSDQP